MITSLVLYTEEQVYVILHFKKWVNLLVFMYIYVCMYTVVKFENML